MQHFYYVKNNSRPNEDKYGIFHNNRFQRILDGKELFSNISKFYMIFEITQTDMYKLPCYEYDDIISIISRNKQYIINLEKLYQCELDHLKNIHKFLIYNGGGTELIKPEGFDNLKNVLIHDFPKLGLNVKQLSEKDIKLINDEIKKEYTQKNIKKNYYSLFFSNINNQLLKQQVIKKQNTWFERNYQNDIIKYCYQHLISNYKIYLELATGGGKTYIVFKILQKINPDIIICFSPRKKINQQNISTKYLSLLNDNYISLNYSPSFNFDNFITKNNKKFITCCTQTHNELFNDIQKYNLSNIFLWIDESHWAIENTWINNINNNNSISYWLTSNNVKYRLFTSASPNKTIIQKNNNIFGKYYYPIKISSLIQKKWLCPIKPYIMKYNKTISLNFIQYILNHFQINNKKWGFSFHNLDINAYNLFMLHYKKFINNETKVKPFLLIDYNNQHDININNIKLNYNYLNINTYENTSNSIAYTVKQFLMGYDFKNLDFIIFSDPKLSSSSIIQCIGRGTRPDKLGPNGTNLNKDCHILIPTFIENTTNKYYKIIEILKYIILNFDIQFSEIINNVTPNNSYKKNILGEEYEGDDIIESIIYNLFFGKKINTKQLNEILINNSISNEKEYNNFRNNHKWLELNALYSYKNFKWKNIVDPNSTKYYETYYDCQLSIKNIKKNINNYDEETYNLIIDGGNKEFHKIDNKIPPYEDLNIIYY